jgi:hypothetical protein
MTAYGAIVEAQLRCRFTLQNLVFHCFNKQRSSLEAIYGVQRARVAIFPHVWEKTASSEYFLQQSSSTSFS